MWFGILSKEERAFYRETINHWKELVLGATGGAFILAIYAICADYYELPKFPASGYALVVGLFAVQAFFLAWRAEHRRAESVLATKVQSKEAASLLLRVYGEGLELRQAIVTSDDSTTIEHWGATLSTWREHAMLELANRLSAGIAFHLCLTSKADISADEEIVGMNSDSTQQGKAWLVLHLDEILRRIREQMKNY